MLKRIKASFITLFALTFLAVPALVPATVSAAATDNIQTQLCTGIGDATGSGDTTCGTEGAGGDNSTITNLLTKIVNIFTLVVGIIAVLMIIIGGFKYITSGGESSNISGAKNTIIYAIIGLIIVALAQVIVHFVVNKVTS